MQDIVEQLLSYIRGIWRQRWYALLVAWTLSIAGWAFVIYQPDQYEATARVQVDSYSILQPLLNDMTVPVSSPERIRQLQQTIKSRPNLEKVVRTADLDLKTTSDGEFDKVVNQLEKNLNFRRAGNNELYFISYTDDDPAQAKRVVQALLNLFIEKALGDTRQDTNSAQRFLEKQIDEYSQRLLESENRLKDFKRKNLGLMPEQGKDYYQRLQEANSRVEEAELELRQAENLAAELQRQLTGESPTFGMMAPPSVTTSVPELDSRIARLQSNLDELLTRYTDKHPDVVNTRSRIDELLKQRQEALKAGASATTGGMPLETNPVFQQLKISASEAEARAASLRVKVAEYRAKAEELDKKVYILPQIEQELGQLTRDYDVTKQNYDKLIQKREQARISQDREQNTSDISFKVIDPPRVPPEPVGPNRLLLLSGVFAVALGAGFAVALVISQVLSTFDSPRMLMQQMQVPVFGTVSLVLSPQAQRIRRVKNWVFLALISALLPVYGGLVYLQTIARVSGSGS
ncbi:XrtA system polysaccharide chain length determinant [Permianibacter aggregans]|uniref:Polysaccharide chain length determinant protein (PEP-CTERM system associated) n=1 Tax=Permianibacter aggregans TaxID=1510150 RepID=A0A4R6UTS4_9GAMM|nr:XrtA system polysaccharide chain length determinant [Permianibacter aggregans]QGX40065.1 chain length-determining protein [Permianibacter aggregans]TDQ49123.1 polysaccharide chain length determinant protein (PEP-CTERM system associated) [Permianibacter aggregans]